MKRKARLKKCKKQNNNNKNNSVNRKRSQNEKYKNACHKNFNALHTCKCALKTVQQHTYVCVYVPKCTRTHTHAQVRCIQCLPLRCLSARRSEWVSVRIILRLNKQCCHSDAAKSPGAYKFVWQNVDMHYIQLYIHAYKCTNVHLRYVGSVVAVQQQQTAQQHGGSHRVKPAKPQQF